jgi:hypothetical protein
MLNGFQCVQEERAFEAEGRAQSAEKSAAAATEQKTSMQNEMLKV